MVERKPYKTKLCSLYQEGHCRRQSCSFAHGSAELRRSIDGSRDYRGSDLRAKLDRRRSPLPRYSPGRDGRGRHTSNGDSPRFLGKTSVSLEAKKLTSSDRKHRKKQHLDDQSDFSGSMRFAEGNEDKLKDPRQASSGSKDFLDEQLRKAQSEIRMLDDRKHRLEICLEERIQEADSLTSRIQDLEMLLSQEKEESKRITSKIKKFVKAYNRQLHLEDELKRSRVQLQKLGEQIGLDITGPLADEDDPGLKTISGGESADKHVSSPSNELQENVSPSNKRRRVHLEMKEISNQGNPTKGEGMGTEKTRLDELSKWNGQSNSISNKKVEANGSGNNVLRPLADDYSSKRSRNVTTDIAPLDKSNVSEPGVLLPSTSMAAHAVDEVVDIVETEEKLEVTGTATETEKEVAFKVPALPCPPPPPLPPPPIPENAYAQYKGDDDENVDIDGIEEESVEVDIV